MNRCWLKTRSLARCALALASWGAGTTLSAPLASAGGDEFIDTGADLCSAAAIIPLPVGPPGSPNTVTIHGASGGASGADCDNLLGDVWWEAFEIDTCATVVIDFCGMDPPRFQIKIHLVGSCDEENLCRPVFQAEEASPICSDFNTRVVFTEVPPGVYRYPLSDGVGPRNPKGTYRMHISAEQCTGACDGCRGACCNTAERTCVDSVFPTECQAAEEKFSLHRDCQETECRPPQVEYDAYGVGLLSRVAVEDFPADSVAANDVWGYASPSGREYAIIGLTESTGFVDITDPTEPVIIADIPDARSTWSDIAVYDTYAYNVNERGGGMQIFDLARIDRGVVELVGSLTTNGFTTAHNVLVNPDSGYAYLAGANAPTNGLVAIDLIDPANPRMVGLWTDHYAHDVYVTNYDDCPYAGRNGFCEIAFVFGTGSGLFVVDVTDKTAMTTIAVLPYQNVSIAHQGWLTEDKRFLLLGDEGDERGRGMTTTTYVIDVQNLANPFVQTSFTNGLAAIDHNMMVRGDLVFQANYTTGLRVHDISDVLNAFEIAYFDTHPDDNHATFDGAWGVFAGLPSGVILLSDMQRGLFVLTLCENATLLPGDFDDDGDTDLRDFSLLQRCFDDGILDAEAANADPTEVEPACAMVDTNCDGKINAVDITAALTITSPILAP